MLRLGTAGHVQKALENKAWRLHRCSLQCKRFNPRQAPRRCDEIRLEASAEMEIFALAVSIVPTHVRFTLDGRTKV